MNFINIFINTYLLVAVANGAQIFVVMPIFGQSHWNVMDAVLQTLLHAGHNITVVTPFIKKEKIANYTQVKYLYKRIQNILLINVLITRVSLILLIKS